MGDPMNDNKTFREEI